ncbi:Lipase domain containing protein [Aphelenchoides bicaudatus]|nr:Lipase domain containing protein [Aphelenchoides bicaudatus]
MRNFFGLSPVTAFVTTLLLAGAVNGLFQTGFQSFLNENYGATVAKQLIRSDLGSNGSFGGNVVSEQLRVYRIPLILVHGLNGNASSLSSHFDYFTRKGYGLSELYATSYGPDKASIDATSAIKCDYVKQIRQLITAVTAYTGKPTVHVVAYSVGAAVARKAILGGVCVDTKENVGAPLTDKIQIFLSVAGSNLGTTECSSFPNAAICNSNNGLKSNSDYLRDINNKNGYEGRARFSVGSQQDDIVGYANLSLPAAQINHSLISRSYIKQHIIDKDAHAESQVSGKNCSGKAAGSENFETGPSDSDPDENNNGEFPGNYNRKSNVYTFVNNVNYTRHTNPSKGNFFSYRSKPYKSG